MRLFVTSFAPSAFTDFIATMSDPTSDTPSIVHRILPSSLSTACMSCIAENVRSPRYAVNPCVLAVLSDPGGPHATQVITDGTYHGLLLITQNRLPLRNLRGSITSRWRTSTLRITANSGHCWFSTLPPSTRCPTRTLHHVCWSLLQQEHPLIR